MRRTLLCGFPAGLSLTLSAALTCCAGAQDAVRATRLQATTAPRLVDCAPVTQTPCMGVSVTPVDASGKPAPVVLPGPDDLAKSFTLHGGEKGDIQPFYASSGTGPDAAQHASVVLLLVDISGSMNQPSPGSPSRFTAVKGAIADFLQGMQEGTDYIAIVPFESHNVVSTIKSAVYATTKAEALAQLSALPTPGPKNNTALYQAVFTGVSSIQGETATLQREGRSGGVQFVPHLIVMTDGKNEVFPGDDPDLLNGDLGLRQAATQVQEARLDVIGIGFGDRASIDAAAMQRLSTRFQYAEDSSQLMAALHIARSAVSHEIQLLWLLPESHRTYLAGKEVVYTPEMRLPANQGTVLGDPVQLLMPAIAAPVFDRVATSPELQTLITTHPPLGADWSLVLFYGLLFLAMGLLLAVLWFWLPRLMWGDQHQAPAADRSRRWAGEKPAVTSASGVQVRSSNLPAGFEPATEGGPIKRSAAQTTQVQPRSEFSRTRLTFEDRK